MDNLPVPRFDLLKTSAFVRPGRAISKSALPRIPIETSRGCPHGCAFCSVTRYFGRTMRFRPIEHVIAEMRHYPGAYFFLVDDNIAADRTRAKELFRAMIPLKNRWIGQFSSLAAADPELLDLARQSGCINAFVGVESFHANSLNSVGTIALRFSNVVRWPLKHPVTPVIYTGMGNRFYRKAIQQRVHPLCGGRGVGAPRTHRADPQAGILR